MSTRRVLAFGSLVALVAALQPDTRVGRAARRLARRLRGHVRHLVDRLQGILHTRWCHGERRDESDLVLGDRVRSHLGPITRDLDLPHIHVMVQDGIALLHGDVATERDRDTLERAVQQVSGIRGVESYLHLGLLPGDTRPSAGRAVHPTSPARQRLELAAKRGGAVAEGEAARAVRAVIATFFERIPEGERSQVLTHLPADVRALTTMPRRLGGTATRLRTVDELVATVMKVDPSLGVTRARLVTDSVIGELALLLPEERTHVAAVLPRELRDLWDRVRPSHPTAPGAASS